MREAAAVHSVLHDSRRRNEPENKVAPLSEDDMAVSVIVPVRNEVENIRPLIEEIRAALGTQWLYEIIYVDDGSNDGTAELLDKLTSDIPQLCVLHHERSCGQSAAVRSGVLAARGKIIATLDGDGQNDPADLPAMIASLQKQPEAGMIAGQRLKRRDGFGKRISSRIANHVRRSILSDDTPDTGCGLKVFSRTAFLRLPYFDHMHRFLPALMRREGFEVGRAVVNHRPRTMGRSKYGINNRLWVGIVDLIGVWWLMRRMRKPTLRA